ncbi:MAG TPA: AAA family ATPase, partial [Candidatus Saccharimonadales bacterium]|nr:AAA family ATPase [Candidatus Saccharimonadales bacterium]
MELNLSSQRAARARLSVVLRRLGASWLVYVAAAAAITAAGMWFAGESARAVNLLLALASFGAVIGLWYRRDLTELPPKAPVQSLDDVLEQNLLASLKKNSPITPKDAWNAAAADWRGRFIVNHLIMPEQLSQLMGGTAADMPAVWRSAAEKMKKQNDSELHAGHLVSALLESSPPAKEALLKINIKTDDINETLSWLSRLSRSLDEPRPYFGGIGRDWASGFTPTLDQFGQNISAAVEAGRGHFHTLAHGDVLDSLVHSLSQPAGNAALVGPAGTGKTSLVYALAERLLAGKDSNLQYYQIVSLNASAILSAAGDKIEKIMLTLFNEAVHARNIVIFLDEAE